MVAGDTDTERPDPVKTIDAEPEKLFFIDMLTKDIELLPAVLDLVDNSVDGAIGLRPDGDLTKQWIRIDFGGGMFSITDNSGGITADTARHYAFRFGRPPNYVAVKRSVGQFGVGMKRAIFKLGREFTVSSQSRGAGAGDGSEFTLHVDVGKWATQRDWTFQFDSVSEHLSLPNDGTAGTKIEVTKLKLSVEDDLADPEIVQQLVTELRVRHQESIQKGLRLLVNGNQLTASRPALQFSDEIRPIVRRFTIDHENGGAVDVKLYAGTVRPKRKAEDPDRDGNAEEFQDKAEAGWYLFCNDRLLLAADTSSITGWGNPAAASHPQYRNFRGYVYLSADDASLLPWNTTKTSVDRDSLVFRAVQTHMKTTLVEVQAVLNRVKDARSQHKANPEGPPPEIMTVIDDTEDVPLGSLPISEKIVAPPAPPKTRSRTNVQRISYVVEKSRYKAVSESLETTKSSEIGVITFDYYYDEEIG